VIWLTWRQHRLQLLAGALTLMVILVFLVVTGIGMQASFNDSGAAACLARNPTGCSSVASAWSSQYSGYQFVIPFFLVLPGIVGVFWGGPLVSRELEHGTHRMVWMQSVTRGRWLLVKLGILAAAVIVGSTLLTLVLEWWSGPLVTAAGDDRFMPGVFDLLGLVPSAYGVFAFGLGVAAGAIIGRTVPAMAATLLTFAGVRVAVEFVLRPHYEPSLTDSFQLSAVATTTRQSSQPGAWQLTAETVDRTGHVVGSGMGIDFNSVVGDCPNLAGPGGAPLPDPSNISACIRQAGIHVVATYQPADRYWVFQGIEAGLFVVLAAVLVAAAFWWVRHRTS
jgi:hypothetical protein